MASCRSMAGFGNTHRVLGQSSLPNQCRALGTFPAPQSLPHGALQLMQHPNTGGGLHTSPSSRRGCGIGHNPGICPSWRAEVASHALQPERKLRVSPLTRFHFFPP